MRDRIARWLFRIGMAVGAAHVTLCLASESYRAHVYTVTDVHWLIAAPVLFYLGLVWGTALAIAVTGVGTRSLRGWEIRLRDFVAFMPE